MTAQELFDHIVLNLRKQGKAALKDGVCVYRGDDNTRCAVGWCIKDTEYVPEMEEKSVRALIGVGLLPKRLHEHALLLIKCQQAHDYCLRLKGMDGWTKTMRDIAADYLLDPSSLD